jgi:ferric-dicitrate binding protein FerR (iron transport regulator)
MNRHVKDLLGKHLDNNLTRDERDELNTLIARLPDAELGEILGEIWLEYAREMSPACFDELIERLQIQPVRKRSAIIKRIARVAAAVILPLCVISLVYLYTETRKTRAFLAQATTVNVQSGDVADITLPDGTRVFLNSATTLSYPSHFGLDNRTVRLTGEAYFKVQKDPRSPFIVNTGYMEIEVLGTEFNVTSYDYLDIVETTLVTGAIKLTTRGDPPRSITLSPREKAIYDKKTGRLTVDATTTRFETAWLQGDLVFRSATFAQIIHKLQLRYGVDIEIEGGKYDADLFTGSFKESSVYNVLKNLQIHYDFTYTRGADDTIQIRF